VGVFRINDLGLRDDVFLGFSSFFQLDEIFRVNIFEDAKEAIAMSRDSQIPRLPDLGGTQDSAHSAVEGEIIGAVENGNLEFQSGDA